MKTAVTSFVPQRALIWVIHAVPAVDGLSMVALFKMPASVGSPEDRRVFPRKEFHAEVESRRMDFSVTAQRHPRFSLSLRDLSLGGLSAISNVALTAGERLAVFFPQQGQLRQWDAQGRVIRCEPSSFGYRVAVEFDPLPMAA